MEGKKKAIKISHRDPFGRTVRRQDFRFHFYHCQNKHKRTIVLPSAPRPCACKIYEKILSQHTIRTDEYKLYVRKTIAIYFKIKYDSFDMNACDGKRPFNNIFIRLTRNRLYCHLLGVS